MELEVRAPAEQTEGTRSQILKWLKAVGEPVTENEPLIELETDKVTVEVAAPGSGVLREILKQEHDEVEPGELLGRIAMTSATSAAQPERLTEAGSATSQPGRAGAGASAAAQPEPVASPSVRPDGATFARSLSDAEGTTHPMEAPDSSSRVGRNVTSSALSPAVRRLLSERGLDASAIRGTGRGGQITVQDVLKQSERSRTAASPANAASRSGAAEANLEALGPSRLVPHTTVRKRIAEHMVHSLLHTAPHVTTVFEADLGNVLAHRNSVKASFAERGTTLTLTAYFIQAAATALRAVPEANSRWTESALQVFESIHIGVATALDTGLVVPVLQDVGQRDLFSIAQGLEELTSRARAGRLTTADVRGGTFTISNHGVSGSLLATPIVINQPQSAILGVGKLEKRPVVTEQAGSEPAVIIRPRCYVTLTIDHRVMDGQRANQFLSTFVENLESYPLRAGH